MEEIEKATGKQIVRIETNDLDEMEEVRSKFPPVFYFFPRFRYLCVVTAATHARPPVHDATFFPSLRLQFSHTARFTPSLRMCALTTLIELFWTLNSK